MSPILITYPIDYKQHVNRKPFEEIIVKSLYDGATLFHQLLQTRLSCFYSGCDDGANAESPTCSWQYDANNTPIANSQGFCCVCEFDDVFGGNRLRRADLDCNLFGNEFQSASCVRFPDSWYKLYDVGPPTVGWTITVSTQLGNLPPVCFTLGVRSLPVAHSMCFIETS